MILTVHSADCWVMQGLVYLLTALPTPKLGWASCCQPQWADSELFNKWYTPILSWQEGIQCSALSLGLKSPPDEAKLVVTPFPTEATKDSARTEAAALVLPAAVLTVAWKMQTEDDMGCLHEQQLHQPCLSILT